MRYWVSWLAIGVLFVAIVVARVTGLEQSLSGGGAPPDTASLEDRTVAALAPTPQPPRVGSGGDGDGASSLTATPVEGAIGSATVSPPPQPVVVATQALTRVAESADAPALEAGALGRAGSNPAPSTILAQSGWPSYLWSTVECIIQRESTGNPSAVGRAGERGLLQIHPVTWSYLAQYGITPDSLFDPATNLRAGYLLYLVGGLAPWGGGC